jgi:hypothetical protein
MTLVELVVGTAVLVGGGGAMLLGMHYAMVHSGYLNGFQIAMNAAQGKIEELSATPFDTLLTGAAFAAARTAAGQCMGLNEDRNCNGALDLGEDLNGNGSLDEPLPSARLTVRIQASPPGAIDPTLLDLYVAACWTAGGRDIGEDQNCNGTLDAGEDINPTNGWADSPVMVSTRIATRE